MVDDTHKPAFSQTIIDKSVCCDGEGTLYLALITSHIQLCTDSCSPAQPYLDVP